jgi:hypothetical protein
VGGDSGGGTKRCNGDGTAAVVIRVAATTNSSFVPALPPCDMTTERCAVAECDTDSGCCGGLPSDDDGTSVILVVVVHRLSGGSSPMVVV